MVGFDPIDVQLVDLEEMYMPWAPAPSEQNTGSSGYRHRSGETTWRPEGDRYAAAVLAAEMLILANPKLARKATDEGFFGDRVETLEGLARFQQARQWLEDADSEFARIVDGSWFAPRLWLEAVAPEFGNVFDSSWFADSLAGCSRISELREPIKKLATSPLPPIVLADPRAVKGGHPSGPKVKQDSSTGIPVSKVPSTVEVPDLIGQSLSETRSMLTGAGLKLGAKAKAPSDDVPEGRIVNQYPGAGTRVKRGSSVTIMLSSGLQEKETIADLSARQSPTHTEAGRNEPSLSGSQGQDERSSYSPPRQGKRSPPTRTAPSDNSPPPIGTGGKRRREVPFWAALAVLVGVIFGWVVLLVVVANDL